MASETKKSLDKQLVDQLERFPSLDKLLLSRNLGMGAALSSFVLLLELLGVNELSFALTVGLVACAVSIPAWVVMAGSLEYYIVLGPKSYAHKRTAFARHYIAALTALGGLALVVALGAVFYHLAPLAAYVYAVAITCSVFLISAFQSHLARWYFSRADHHGGEQGGT